MNKAGVLIQARVGSTRLPGKVLLNILNKTVLEHVIERVRRAEAVDKIVVATSTKEEDAKIAALAKDMGIDAYRGSEDDVLDRFYQAAKLYKMKHIARITADCPLIDPDIIDRAVTLYFDSKADYCTNCLERTFPDGEDVEVFSFGALRYAWKNAGLLSEREHVTPYIRKNPDRFKLVNFKNGVNIGEKRWTLDETEDFEFIKIIFGRLYPVKPDFSMKDILDFLALNPCAEEINKNIKPGEGYLKSLKNDRRIDTNRFKE